MESITLNTIPMKKLLFMLLAMFLVAGCSKSEKETPPAETQLEVSKASVDFTEEAGKEIVNITTNNEWTAAFVNDRASEWCTINPKSGVAGLTAMEISVKENTTPDSRSASVNISSGGKTKTLQISQKQKNALTVTSDKFEVSYEGGQISIEAKHNVNLTYTIESAAQSWIKYVSTKALKTSNLVFDVLPNENKEKREGKIVITGGSASDGLSEEITVYQEGEKPAIVLTKNEISVSSDASTIDIDVKSNVDVQVQIPSGAGWITHSQTKAMSTNTYSFDIQANEEYDQRSATITFINEQNGLSESVTITQKHKNALLVSNSIMEVDAVGGNITVEVKHNVDFEYKIGSEASDWIKAVQTKGLSTTELNFNIYENVGYTSRTGHIIVYGNGLSDTVTVKQKEKFTIDPDAIPHDEIWYTTSTNRTIDPKKVSQIYTNITMPFDKEVISNTYENGFGKIKFNGNVTVVNSFVFCSLVMGDGILTGLYLPNSIEQIGTGAIENNDLTTLHIPKNLRSIDSYGLTGEKLEKFTGHNISEDGRCVIVNKKILAYAQAGIKDYTTPEGVEEIGSYAFYKCPDLETIRISEGVKVIGFSAISRNANLGKVYLPKSLQTIESYVLMECPNLEGFYGNEEFHTPDNRVLISYQASIHRPADWHGIYTIIFAGKGITDYTIPEGVKGVENYTFTNCPDLKSLTIPESLRIFAAQGISNCPNFEAVYGYHTSEDHRCIQFDDELTRLIVTKDLPKTYHIPSNIKKIGYSAFSEISEIEHVVVGDQVTELGGYAFYNCPNLKSVVLSGNLERIGSRKYNGYNPFLRSTALEAIYFRSYVPPTYLDSQMSDFTNLKVYVPDVVFEAYKRDSGWSEFRKYMEPYECKDMPEPQHYVSKDYSKHGEVTTLQKATVGKGIDFVIMGDIYSDRMIADGTYESHMRTAVDQFFALEPFKSFRNMFNVYMVTAVSAVEQMFKGSTAFSTQYPPEGGNGMYGYDPLAVEFSQKATGKENMDDVISVVLVNDPGTAGICLMADPETENNNWGSGYTLSYFPISSDISSLQYLMNHETGGHGFAKLADEYIIGWSYVDAMEKIEALKRIEWGWYKNIDFTDNPAEAKWSKFISDPRYASENVGLFEGGYTYKYGVWRPTENSIMNTAMYGIFNAPSREAIYYRLHKLAYGADWEYNYETFAEYDAVNRTATDGTAVISTAEASASKPHRTARTIKLNKTWKDILEEGKKGTFKIGEYK